MADAVKLRLPNLYALESWMTLRTVGIVAALLGLLGLLAWKFGPELVEKYVLKPAIVGILQEELVAEGSPVGRVESKVGSISQLLHETFGSQVDSGSFKILRFGCTPGGVQRSSAFPVCSGDLEAIKLQKENQKLLIVANPGKQVIRLNLTAFASSPETVRSLLLQITAARPTIEEGMPSSRQVLEILPAHVGENQTELVKDGRLRLLSSNGFLTATVDLTPSLLSGNWKGPFFLEFDAVVEQSPPAASPADSKPVYVGASGTELFSVSTVTTVFHSIPALAKGDEN